MYELKTLLPQFDINLPKCMYEMKNVSLSANAVANSAAPNTASRSLNVSSNYLILLFFFGIYGNKFFLHKLYVVIIVLLNSFVLF